MDLDMIRAIKERIPSGEFHAPLWIIKREYHNNSGWHLHILRLKNSNYVRTEMALTVLNGEVLVYYHGENKAEYEIGQISNSLRKELTPMIKEEIRQIKGGNWVIPPQGKSVPFGLRI